MSESPKKTEENKPQTDEKPKPTSPPPKKRNLRTHYTFVANSAEDIKKKDK